MKFIERAKRRRDAGIYLARVDRHRGWGRVNGYVGRSNSMALRWQCHEGRCRHKGHHAKPWTIGLNLHWHRLVRLPWWLSWKWVQVPLEAFFIVLLLPLYNVQLNTKNPRRVLPSEARIQLARRQARAQISRGSRRFSPLTVFGAVLILVGVGMSVLGAVR